MMRLIANDVVDTSSLYLSHGITWGKHRYIRREGSPGHYTYVYPEDTQKQGFISRVKSAIDSRNTSGATLFGNPINRRAYQNKSAQVSRMQKNYNKAVKQVTSGGKKIAIETSRATDPSRSEEYRGKHQERLKKLQDAQKEKVNALTNYESRVKEAEARLNSVKMAYDRTRKIDDIAPAVISEFKKLFRKDGATYVDISSIANSSGTINRQSSQRSVANKRIPNLSPEATNVDISSIANSSGTINRQSSQRSVANKRYPWLNPDGTINWLKARKATPTTTKTKETSGSRKTWKWY